MTSGYRRWFKEMIHCCGDSAVGSCISIQQHCHYFSPFLVVFRCFLCALRIKRSLLYIYILLLWLFYIFPLFLYSFLLVLRNKLLWTIINVLRGNIVYLFFKLFQLYNLDMLDMNCKNHLSHWYIHLYMLYIDLQKLMLWLKNCSVFSLCCTISRGRTHCCSQPHHSYIIYQR